MLWWGLSVLVILLVTGFAAGRLYQQHSEHKREDLEAMAARRGWSLSFTNHSLGRPALLKLSSRGGSEWEARSRSSPENKTYITEFIGREPTWPEAHLFLGAAPNLSRLKTTPQDDATQEWIYTNIISDGVGADLSGLTQFDGTDELIVMATTDPRLRVDIKEMSKLWASWEPSKPNSDYMPVLVLGPEGIRIRLRHAIGTADQMERFIDLALAMARIAGAAR